MPKAWADLNHYLRDVRGGEMHHFTPRLFDLLYDLTASLNHAGGEIDAICGYRTPETKEVPRRMLRLQESEHTSQNTPSTPECPQERAQGAAPPFPHRT